MQNRTIVWVIVLLCIALLLIAVGRQLGDRMRLGSSATSSEASSSEAFSESSSAAASSEVSSLAASVPSVALILLADNGVHGPLIGCGDSVVFVPIAGTSSGSVSITQALEALFSKKFQTDEHTYNVLGSSSITILDADVKDTTAVVHLSGSLQLAGECDDPRAEAQIEQTVLRAAGVDTAQIYLNEKTLHEALSLK